MRIHNAHKRSPDHRVHKAIALSAAGALSVGAGASMVVAGGPAVADPPGNNGFIKVVTVDDGAEIPQNMPHVPCSFKVQWFNFDEGPDPDSSSDVMSHVGFELQAPTVGDGYTLVPTGLMAVPVGEDAAGGGGDLDAEQVYSLSFTGQPQANQGYHVKLTVNTSGSLDKANDDSKSKVYWIGPCEAEEPEEPEEPVGPTEPEEPAGPDEPEILPEDDERTDDVAPEQDDVLAAEDTVPTQVDAGITETGSPIDTWGIGLMGAGLAMMVAAGAGNVRGSRRGEH